MITPTVLTGRLQSIASLIGKNNRLIDIGSDHGYIASFALENNLAQTVVASDIHRFPAERTRRYLNRQGFSNRSEVQCADGLDGIKLRYNDTVVIAGMGGLEIVRILSDMIQSHNSILPMHTEFILQPQRSFEEVRRFLCDNGFSIVQEKISIDRNRIYVIIMARYERCPYALTLTELILGPQILKTRPEGFLAYLENQRYLLGKRLRARTELESVIKFIDEVN